MVAETLIHKHTKLYPYKIDLELQQLNKVP